MGKKNGGLIIRCRHCGDEIQSMSRHDYRSCKCGKIAIDGGTDYTRINGNFEDWELLNLAEDFGFRYSYMIDNLESLYDYLQAYNKDYKVYKSGKEWWVQFSDDDSVALFLWLDSSSIVFRKGYADYKECPSFKEKALDVTDVFDYYQGRGKYGWWDFNYPDDAEDF